VQSTPLISTTVSNDKAVTERACVAYTRRVRAKLSLNYIGTTAANRPLNVRAAAAALRALFYVDVFHVVGVIFQSPVR